MHKPTIVQMSNLSWTKNKNIWKRKINKREENNFFFSLSVCVCINSNNGERKNMWGLDIGCIFFTLLYFSILSYMLFFFKMCVFFCEIVFFLSYFLVKWKIKRRRRKNSNKNKAHQIHCKCRTPFCWTYTHTHSGFSLHFSLDLNSFFFYVSVFRGRVSCNFSIWRFSGIGKKMVLFKGGKTKFVICIEQHGVVWCGIK